MTPPPPDHVLDSVSWFNPLRSIHLEFGPDELVIIQNQKLLTQQKSEEKIPFGQIETFEVVPGKFLSGVRISTRNHQAEYTLSGFRPNEVEQFASAFRQRLMEDTQSTTWQNRVIEFPELALESTRLLEGNDEQICGMVSLLLIQAVKHRCSDVHFDPQEEQTTVRFRTDGMFHKILDIPKHLERQVVARIKVMARLVTFETRVPQEGRISMQVGRRDVDMRVSVYPTLLGEKVAIRLFDTEGSQFGLDRLGHAPELIMTLKKLLGKPSGTILLTGPSGSGKTTTIYAVLQEIQKLHSRLTNIVTIEDPIEHRLDGIQQTEVFEPKGLTFLAGLRAMLRQNAEVIMVGEIRDAETASVGIQAGLTGHMVISTIHAGTSARVIARLTEMGIEPFLIASSLTAIMSQRLPRKNCPRCLETYYPPEEILEEIPELVEEGVDFKRGRGCTECHGIGMSGRTPVSELLVVDEQIEQMIQDRMTVRDIELAARAKGMRTLWEDGMDRVRNGEISPEELVRIVPKPISTS